MQNPFVKLPFIMKSGECHAFGTKYNLLIGLGWPIKVLQVIVVFQHIWQPCLIMSRDPGNTAAADSINLIKLSVNSHLVIVFSRQLPELAEWCKHQSSQSHMTKRKTQITNQGKIKSSIWPPTHTSYHMTAMLVPNGFITRWTSSIF